MGAIEGEVRTIDLILRVPAQVESVRLSVRTGRAGAWVCRPGAIAPRAALVVLHGAGNDRSYPLGPLVDAAIQRGFLVLSCDLPGHGRGGTTLFEAARAAEDTA